MDISLISDNLITKLQRKDTLNQILYLTKLIIALLYYLKRRGTLSEKELEAILKLD